MGYKKKIKKLEDTNRVNSQRTVILYDAVFPMPSFVFILKLQSILVRKYINLSTKSQFRFTSGFSSYV